MHNARYWPLPRARLAIIAAGCLAMAYTQLTTSPATVQFARSLGASGFHIGILGALPVGLVCMQLVSAATAGRLARRKPTWFWISIFQRLVLAPAALGPWLLPSVPDAVWVWVLLGLTALNQALLHYGTPLWLSWMGDYLPQQGLSEFWGRRHSAQQATAAVALLASALLAGSNLVNPRAGFTLAVLLGCALGLADILLFLRIEEPPPRHPPQPRLTAILAGPLRHREFRSFILFSCYWHMAAMVGAPFISMFLLEHVQMSLWDVLLLWTLSWVGGAAVSSRLGRCADRYGQRPVLVLCTAGKSLNMLALLACPSHPAAAFWLLAPVFMVDAFLNAGIAIATNGFLLKNSPRENRTMFVAAGTAYAGVAGGLMSVAAGALLTAGQGWSFGPSSHPWTNFHVLFAISVAMRVGGALLATRVREPRSAGARQVLGLAVRAVHWRVALAARGWRSDAPTTTLPPPHTGRFGPQPPAELVSRSAAR